MFFFNVFSSFIIVSNVEEDEINRVTCPKFGHPDLSSEFYDHALTQSSKLLNACFEKIKLSFES